MVMGTRMVIDFAAAKQVLDNRAAIATGRDYCGCCYDQHGFVAFLVPHKVWGGDVGQSCPECHEVFE